MKTGSNLGLWLSFIKTYRLIQADLSEHLRKEHNLSLAQFQFLSQLAFHKRACTMSELANALLLSNGNITGLAKRLKRDGWIQTSQSSHDKRVYEIDFTPAGRNAFLDVVSSYETWIDAIFQEIGETEAREMRDFFYKIRPKNRPV